MTYHDRRVHTLVFLNNKLTIHGQIPGKDVRDLSMYMPVGADLTYKNV